MEGIWKRPFGWLECAHLETQKRRRNQCFTPKRAARVRRNGSSGWKILLLTRLVPLARFDAVSILKMKTTLNMCRVVSAATLLFVFFLPLHFHFAFTAQVVKECSCVHGTRTHLVPHSGPTTIAPTLQITVFATQYVFSWAGDWSTPQNVRGPPTTLSV